MYRSTLPLFSLFDYGVRFRACTSALRAGKKAPARLCSAERNRQPQITQPHDATTMKSKTTICDWDEQAKIQIKNSTGKIPISASKWEKCDIRPERMLDPLHFLRTIYYKNNHGIELPRTDCSPSCRELRERKLWLLDVAACRQIEHLLVAERTGRPLQIAIERVRKVRGRSCRMGPCERVPRTSIRNDVWPQLECVQLPRSLAGNRVPDRSAALRSTFRRISCGR